MRACGVATLGGRAAILAIPDPPVPAPGQVLVAVEAAGVGNWDDLVRRGLWDVGLRAPGALGVEGAARVIEVGNGVDGLAPGDPVLAHEAPLPGGSGFWAERMLLDARHVARRPSGLDAVTAAALPIGGLTAQQALDRLDLGPGKRLLVTGGAGGTGSLAVQLAARAGIAVTTTASSGQADRLRGLGAERVVDYHDPAWPDRTGGRFDAVLVAAKGTAEIAAGLVRDGGRLCSLTGDAPPSRPGLLAENLYVRPDGPMLRRLAESAASGDLRPEPEPVPLAEGPDALARVAAGRAAGYKIVLLVGDGVLTAPKR